MNRFVVLVLFIISVVYGVTGEVDTNSIEKEIYEWCLANKEELPDVIRYNLTIENIRETKFLQPDSVEIESFENGMIKKTDINKYKGMEFSKKRRVSQALLKKLL